MLQLRKIVNARNTLRNIHVGTITRKKLQDIDAL